MNFEGAQVPWEGFPRFPLSCEEPPLSSWVGRFLGSALAAHWLPIAVALDLHVCFVLVFDIGHRLPLHLED